MALLTATLIIAVVVTAARAGGPNLKVLWAEATVATWKCQSLLGVERTPQYYDPWQPHSTAFRAAQFNAWKIRYKACNAKLQRRKVVNRAVQQRNLSGLTTAEIYWAADREVANGGIYGIGWGAASPTLQALCYEALTREFGVYGWWARKIVNRESGCNPGAVNTKYSAWRERAQCVAQMIPKYHTWVDYSRCARDLRYSIHVFKVLSRGGRATGPWS